jgi:hypothetical protein
MREYLRPLRHLLSALLVVLGGAVAAAFVALDLSGVGLVVIPGVGPVDTRMIGFFVILGTALAAAGKLAEANARIEELTNERSTYGSAPIVGWTDPRLHLNDDGSISLTVWCENSGPSESVATYVQFGVVSDQPLDGFRVVSQLNVWSPIKAHKLGAEHRFMIMMTSAPDRPLGTREITWFMVYSDRAHPEIAYLTQASLKVDAQQRGPVQAIGGTVFLDATSTPKERRQRYLDHVAR